MPLEPRLDYGIGTAVGIARLQDTRMLLEPRLDYDIGKAVGIAWLKTRARNISSTSSSRTEPCGNSSDSRMDQGHPPSALELRTVMHETPEY